MLLSTVLISNLLLCTISTALEVPWTRTHRSRPRAAAVDGSLDSAISKAAQAPRPKAPLELPVNGDEAHSIGSTLNMHQSNHTMILKELPEYPIDCFEPDRFDIPITNSEDCEFVINDIILHIPRPMHTQTWGYNDSADIDLTLPEYMSFYHGRCLVALGSWDKTEEERFRPVDVAIAAQRILQECVKEHKTALGGTTNIGDHGTEFYVVLGGTSLPPGFPHERGRSLLQNSTHSQMTHAVSTIKSESPNLKPRAARPTELLVSDKPKLPISCVQLGQPADAGPLNVPSCSSVLRRLLTEPKVLVFQSFTTEATGGIRVPFVRFEGECFLMVNTQAKLSTSDEFSWVKVVYYASEVMRKCELGGVAKLTGETGFFVSLTGIDPAEHASFAGLLNSTAYSGRAEGGLQVVSVDSD